MKKNVGSLIKAGVLSLGAALLVLTNASTATAVEKPAQGATQQVGMNWKDFHSVTGNCTMKFPEYPQHVSENMNVPEEGYNLKYDAYISASEQKTVYMLLIAQYPDFVNESYARMSLESFLNGILSHNPGNQLIFADLLLVDGHEALDFFIRTGGVYFKGRAMMVKNSLYLMAMECDVKAYDEPHYNHFITSFQLAK
jgi:hypothetical protein